MRQAHGAGDSTAGKDERRIIDFGRNTPRKPLRAPADTQNLAPLVDALTKAHERELSN